MTLSPSIGRSSRRPPRSSGGSEEWVIGLPLMTRFHRVVHLVWLACMERQALLISLDALDPFSSTTGPTPGIFRNARVLYGSSANESDKDSDGDSSAERNHVRIITLRTSGLGLISTGTTATSASSIDHAGDVVRSTYAPSTG